MIRREQIVRLLFIVIIGLSSLSAHAQRTVASNGGNWNNTSTWIPTTRPGLGDAITWTSSNNKTVTVNAADGNGRDLTAVKAGTINIDTYTLTFADFVDTKNGFNFNLTNGGTLVILGDFIADNNVVFNICTTCSVTVTNFIAENGANIDISGSFNVVESFTAVNNAVVSLGPNALLDVGENLTTGSNAVLNVNSTGAVNVGNTLNLGGGSTVIGEGVVSAPNCTGAACDDPQLPITLGAFALTGQSNSVRLDWTTLSELNFEYFEIQRANAAMEFETISTLPGSGNSNQSLDYSWTDELPNLGINYYRLISNDFDGYQEIFPAKYILFLPDDLEVSVYPNPVPQGGAFKINTGSNQIIEMILYNLQGQVVFSASSSESEFILNVKPGTYILSLDINGLQKNQRILVR